MDAVIKPVEARFYFRVGELWTVRSRFKAGGFERSFTLLGRCFNGETDTRNRFNGKGARIDFQAPVLKDASLGAKPVVEDPCGSILIRKDVQPKPYDCGFGPEFDPPIIIQIGVGHEVLDRLFETASRAIEDNRVLSFTLTMTSATPPAKRWISPDDLDVSEDHSYPVTDFELTPTVIRLSDPTDPRPQNPGRSSSPDITQLNVRLNEVRAEMHSDRLRYSFAAMSGNVTRPAELRDVETRMEIKEFERDRRTGDYLGEALPGVFFFSPDHDGYLDLTLYFTLRDHETLIPILLGSPSVELSVWLSVAGPRLISTKEPMHGDVTSYTFSFRATK
jgi:hypothetical protein